jgi:hypothetical protein
VAHRSIRVVYFWRDTLCLVPKYSFSVGGLSIVLFFGFLIVLWRPDRVSLPVCICNLFFVHVRPGCYMILVNRVRYPLTKFPWGVSYIWAAVDHLSESVVYPCLLPQQQQGWGRDRNGKQICLGTRDHFFLSPSPDSLNPPWSLQIIYRHLKMQTKKSRYKISQS